MTADPIAGIPYPVLTGEADITAIMKPVVDPIGAFIGSPPHWYEKRIGVGPVSSGTVIGSLVIPAKPFASLVHIVVIGVVTNTNVAFTGASSSASAGVLTDIAVNAPLVPSAGFYTGFSYIQDLALPAGIACNYVLTSSMGAGTATYHLAATATIYPAGQYSVS